MMASPSEAQMPAPPIGNTSATFLMRFGPTSSAAWVARRRGRGSSSTGRSRELRVVN